MVLSGPIRGEGRPEHTTIREKNQRGLKNLGSFPETVLWCFTYKTAAAAGEPPG